MDVRQRLAVNVRRFRKETGLSQEDFANVHGIDRTYVIGIERGGAQSDHHHRRALSQSA